MSRCVGLCVYAGEELENSHGDPHPDGRKEERSSMTRARGTHERTGVNL
jgi:hypothetical protein